MFLSAPLFSRDALPPSMDTWKRTNEDKCKNKSTREIQTDEMKQSKQTKPLLELLRRKPNGLGPSELYRKPKQIKPTRQTFPSCSLLNKFSVLTVHPHPVYLWDCPAPLYFRCCCCCCSVHPRAN